MYINKTNYEHKYKKAREKDKLHQTDHKTKQHHLNQKWRTTRHDVYTYNTKKNKNKKKGKK